MPTPYAAHLAAADAALDAELGERAEVTPQKAGRFGAAPAADRPAFTVVALVADPRVTDELVGHHAARIRSEQWEIDIRRDLLSGQTVLPGDHVRLPDRPGEPLLSVNIVERTDLGRIRLHCGPI